MSYYWGVRNNHASNMNTNNVIKSLAVAALFTTVFAGFVTVNANLPLVALTIGYVAALAILGFAAFDGKRTA